MLRISEREFYPLATIIHHPEAANPAFGYRLLFPLCARLVEHLRPSLTDHNAFVVVQTIVIALTVWLVGEWVRLFWPRFGRPLGYVLLAVMLTPTISYLNFYDIAIVGFWAACLWLLYHQHWIGYLVVFGIATLNHENNLLLIPVAFVFALRSMSLLRLALLTAAQLALYGSLRYAVIHAVHGAPLWDNRLAQNLAFWQAYSTKALVYSALVLWPWWGLAAKGWKHAPRLLRCASLALPGLFLVTLLFGRFDEARQFDALIPIVIALVACWLRGIGQPRPGHAAPDSSISAKTSWVQSQG